MSNYLQRFSDNEALHNQAMAFWHKLESTGPELLIIMAVSGIAFAAWYYGPYNNAPGRHYKVGKWGIWLGIACAFVFLATLGIEYVLAAPKLDGSMKIEIWVAFANVVYAAFVYIVTSAVWCNCLPTNANRFLKIK